MYRLFQPSPINSEGSLFVPHWPRIQEGLRRSVDKVIEYHRRNPRPLDGGHLLVRLLDSITVSKSLPLEIFHDKVVDVTFDIAATMGLTSTLHRGRVMQPGPCYGENVSEILIATIEPYDLNQMKTNWRAMRPIRTLYHPLTDLTLGVPDGKTRGTEGGPVVIVINVPMLAAQYRMWCIEENKERESKRTVGQFLQQYALPNMLYSHIDIAIVNRMISRYFDIEMPEPVNPHSFFQIDWHVHCDEALDRWIALWRMKNSWNFDALISNFPQIYSSDYHKVIRAPEASYTRQIQWAIVVANIAIWSFLLHFNEATNNQANQAYMSQLRIYLRRMDFDKIMRDAMNNQRYDEVMTMINMGIKPYL